ncbi:uncharacterized protein [Drosophila bipectinata]|uniref:uncharacterized protein n=1 Tax=Drosophila bipectinata TaxID=42026 RepID=UPI0038B40A46
MGLHTLVVLTLLGFGLLGQHLTEANCEDTTHDFWKDESQVDEGTCSRPLETPQEEEAMGPKIGLNGAKESFPERTKHEVRPQSFMDTLVKVGLFLWQVIRWYFNLK